MIPKLRTTGYTIFFIAILGNVTHVLSSGVFLIMIVVAVGFNFAYLAAAKKFPFNKAERVQQTADRASSLAEAIPAGYGVIYAFREGRLPGAVIEVTLDDTTQADVAHATFAKWTVAAGRHMLRANGKGANAVPFDQASAITLELAAGQSAYVGIQVSASLSKFTAQLALEPASQTLPGRVQSLTLAQSKTLPVPLT